jgi:hypothetical protein
MNEEDQKKADEAAWSEGRIQCAAVRDVRLDEARDDIRAIDAAWSAYHDSCVAIDDRWDAAKAKREKGLRQGEHMSYKDIKTFSERCETHPNHQHGMMSSGMICDRLYEEVEELRMYIEAMEQLVVGEDWMERGEGNVAVCPPKQEWVGLTDDEIENLRNDQPWWMVRDIEAKLKEKNT